MSDVDYARCYHQGVRVPDLDAAMAELGAALSLDVVRAAGTGAGGLAARRRRHDGAAAVHLLGGRDRNTSSCCRERRGRCGTAASSPGCTTSGCGPTTLPPRPSAWSPPAGRCASPSAIPPTATACSPTCSRRAACWSSSCRRPSSRCSSAGSPAVRWRERAATTVTAGE